MCNKPVMAERQTRNAVDVDFAGSTPANRIIMCSKIDQYRDRFVWHEGELKMSKTDIPISEEELAHAKEVIKKIIGRVAER